jgi:argininosuccinate lyase
VRQLLAERRDFASLTLAEWRRFSDLFDEGILEAVTPQASVAARRTPQSTQPAAVAAALGEAKAWLARLQALSGRSSLGEGGQK